MGRIEEALDRLELHELVERYAVGADTRDREMLGGAFTEDGVLVTSAAAHCRSTGRKTDH